MSGVNLALMLALKINTFVFFYLVLNLAKFDEIQEKTKCHLSQNLDFNQTCIKGHVSIFVLLNND